MEKLVRFYNQNRRAIYKWICIIGFGLLFIHLLNWYYEEQAENNYENENVIVNNNVINNTANTSSNNKTQNSKTEIDTFIDYCKNKDYENAYNMLSDETKEKDEYSTKEKFIENFINSFINSGTQYLTTKLNITSSVYMIEVYKEDILSTGNTSDVLRKYATINQNKIILNDYIEIEESSNTISKDNIEFKLNTVTYYYDYTECELVITNNSENSLNIKAAIENAYIEVKDKKIFLNKEVLSNFDTNIETNTNITMKLKFDVNYKTDRWNIENLILYEDENVKLKL